VGVVLGFYILIWALLLCKIVILQNHYPKKLPYDKFLKVI